MKQSPGTTWQRVALGKGTLLLHELRKLLGRKKFVALMEESA